MRARSFDQLEAEGLLERREVDTDRVRRWVQRARRDLKVSREVLATVDPERAMTVAYEAGFHACAGFLGLAGYRVRSQPGHHRAAIEGASHLLPEGDVPALDVLDDARRFRNASLYDEPGPLGDDDLAELTTEVERIVSALEARLQA